jgi:hypothetical protein
MTIIGKNFSKNSNGETVTTLHVSDEFNQYYNNSDAGRGCEGKRVESIYIGTYDATSLKVGQSIDIFYDKAITTSKGTFQTIKSIQILK